MQKIFLGVVFTVLSAGAFGDVPKKFQGVWVGKDIKNIGLPRDKKEYYLKVSADKAFLKFQLHLQDGGVELTKDCNDRYIKYNSRSENDVTLIDSVDIKGDRRNCYEQIRISKKNDKFILTIIHDKELYRRIVTLKKDIKWYEKYNKITRIFNNALTLEENKNNEALGLYNEIYNHNFIVKYAKIGITKASELKVKAGFNMFYIYYYDKSKNKKTKKESYNLLKEIAVIANESKVDTSLHGKVIYSKAVMICNGDLGYINYPSCKKEALKAKKLGADVSELWSEYNLGEVK